MFTKIIVDKFSILTPEIIIRGRKLSMDLHLTIKMFSFTRVVENLTVITNFNERFAK
jgi:hypothetical protein